MNVTCFEAPTDVGGGWWRTDFYTDVINRVECAAFIRRPKRRCSNGAKYMRMSQDGYEDPLCTLHWLQRRDKPVGTE